MESYLQILDGGIVVVWWLSVACRYGEDARGGEKEWEAVIENAMPVRLFLPATVSSVPTASMSSLSGWKWFVFEMGCSR